ncbi:RNA polymerase sigma factor [Enterococcus caccae]|uniref:Sigma-70 family RNA polymerase sigma factor n=1 Tax=Enterococcus caccae ATCC BAA-1240 TaxID=1158612 RepID=R3W791_9ENTE|nr:sigma-70 family RNA polymerase sigma factor [Enterococcus caccae]EOL43646.1 hypothetical protein UC7_02976 [Enterococcus caccae ATCC BAA-1240]EOT67954.1 hypothetical protein I580_00336 [Enterococcus caccae ATCC BAA-1240]
MSGKAQYSNQKVENQITSYLNKVIVNAANNYYNTKNRRQEREYLIDDMNQVPTENYTIEMQVPNTVIVGIPIYIQHNRTFELLTSLKEKEALFLVYHYFLELNIPEVAALLKMKVSGVYSLRNRLLKKIRRNFRL